MSAVDANAAPAPRERDHRCSPWTRAHGVDPIGSSGQLDELVLVEWPLPWPADVGEIDALAAVARPGTRVMAVVPSTEADDGLRRVVHRRRAGTHSLAGVDHRVPAEEIPDLLATIVDDRERPLDSWPTVVGAAPPEVLVCGHGRRDPCCGRWGTLLHAELLGRGIGARVSRCSHTGGHRFAPTAITLPDGRAWAYADGDLLEGVLTRTADVATLATHDRGSTAFDMWVQVVERALFVEHGWAWMDATVTEATTSVAADGLAAEVALAWHHADGATARARGRVVVSRVLPVLVCGQPPEAAKKTSPELELAALELEAG